MELIFQESFCISISFGRDCFFISCFSSCCLPSIIGVTPFVLISKVSKIDSFQRQNHWVGRWLFGNEIISLMTYLTTSLCLSYLKLCVFNNFSFYLYQFHPYTSLGLFYCFPLVIPLLKVFSFNSEDG